MQAIKKNIDGTLLETIFKNKSLKYVFSIVNDLEKSLKNLLIELLQEYYEYPELIDQMRLDYETLSFNDDELKFKVIYNTQTHLACSNKNFKDTEVKMPICIKKEENQFHLIGEEWFERTGYF